MILWVLKSAKSRELALVYDFWAYLVLYDSRDICVSTQHRLCHAFKNASTVQCPCRKIFLSRHKISSSARSPRRDIFRSAWIREIPMLPAAQYVIHTINGAACKHSKIANKICWSLSELTRFELFPRSRLLETFQIAWRAALDTETSLSANAAPAAAAASEIPRLSCWHGPPAPKVPSVTLIVGVSPEGWDFCWGGAWCLGNFQQKNVYQSIKNWLGVCNLSRMKGSNNVLSILKSRLLSGP